MQTPEFIPLGGLTAAQRHLHRHRSALEAATHALLDAGLGNLDDDYAEPGVVPDDDARQLAESLRLLVQELPDVLTVLRAALGGGPAVELVRAAQRSTHALTADIGRLVCALPERSDG
jgi:hypothetical protein